MVTRTAEQLNFGQIWDGEKRILAAYGVDTALSGVLRALKSDATATYGVEIDGKTVARRDVIGWHNLQKSRGRLADLSDYAPEFVDVNINDFPLPEWARVCYLANAHVLPEYRNKGLGTLMMRRALMDIPEGWSTLGITAEPAVMSIVEKNGGHTKIGDDWQLYWFSYPDNWLFGERRPRYDWRGWNQVNCDHLLSVSNGPYTLPYAVLGWRDGKLLFSVLAETNYYSYSPVEAGDGGDIGARQGQVVGMLSPDLTEDERIKAISMILGESDFSLHRWISIIQMGADNRAGVRDAAKVANYDLGHLDSHRNRYHRDDKQAMWIFGF